MLTAGPMCRRLESGAVPQRRRDSADRRPQSGARGRDGEPLCHLLCCSWRGARHTASHRRQPREFSGAARQSLCTSVLQQLMLLLLLIWSSEQCLAIFADNSQTSLDHLSTATNTCATSAGACGGGRRPDPVLERRAGDGRAGRVARHWRSLPPPLCHRAARGAHSQNQNERMSPARYLNMSLARP